MLDKGVLLAEVRIINWRSRFSRHWVWIFRQSLTSGLRLAHYISPPPCGHCARSALRGGVKGLDDFRRVPAFLIAKGQDVRLRRIVRVEHSSVLVAKGQNHNEFWLFVQLPA